MYRPRISLPPRTIIGYLPSGRAVYNLAGGSGEGDTGGAGGTSGGSGDGDQGDGAKPGQGAQPPAAVPAKQTAADPPKPAAAAAADPNVPTVAGLQAQLDAAKSAQAGQLDAIAKALGLKGDDKSAATPEQLATRVTDLETTNRGMAVELAVLKRAGALGANGGRLTDSRTFITAVSKLDPADAKFDSKVDDAIKAAVAADASLKTTPPPVTRSGGDFNGGPGIANKPKSMQDAVAARLAG